jgi:membrane fusion protein, heavy metal efflux system
MKLDAIKSSVASAMLALCAAALLTSGCGQKPAAREASAPAPPKSEGVNQNVIHVDDNLRGRIRVGPPGAAEVGEEITVTARVAVDEARVMRIGSPVLARVLSLAVQEGQEVQEGQLLAEVNSVQLADAQLDFLKSMSQRQMARRAVDRARILRDAEVIGVAELQRREAESEQAAADLDAARDRLLQLGMTLEAVSTLEKTRAIRSSSGITASMSGTIMARQIRVGQVVQPADTMFEIADLSRVWLVADVPEQNASAVTVGNAVEAEVTAIPGRVFRGRLSFVSATLNPETRTVRARMDLTNPKRELKPEMLASMKFRHLVEHRQVVPATAVVRDGDAEYVFLERDGSTYELTQVSLGREEEGRRVVLNGICPGSRVVLDGAFHLNNERRRRALRGSGN